MNDKTTEILTDRDKTHGDFIEHARITQALKNVMAVEYKVGLHTPVHREALEMIVHKIGRILAGDPDYIDHWQDIAGYAILAADRVG